MGIDEGGGQGGGGQDLAGLLAKRELAAKEKQELTDKIDNQGKELKFIRGLICDSEGRCRLPTREEAAEMNQPIRDEVKKLTGAFESFRSEAANKAKAKVPAGFIKEDEHKKMWQLLSSCKEPGCGLDYIRKAMGKDYLTGLFVCTSPECKALREKLQKEHGIEIKVGKPGEKKEERPRSFLRDRK